MLLCLYGSFSLGFVCYASMMAVIILLVFQCNDCKHHVFLKLLLIILLYGSYGGVMLLCIHCLQWSICC